MYIYLSYICKILNSNNVQYLIIGGTSVGYHGYSRITYSPDGKEIDKYDFDIWYNPTYSNNKNLLQALKQFGFNVKENDITNFSFYSKNFEKYKLDILPKILNYENIIDSSKRFRLYYNNCDVSEYNDIDMLFINKNDLIESKKLIGRKKDIDDIDNLLNTN